ncbi:MAG: hypothetical protein ABIF71_11860 [Planctomycetota bacterium]
MSHPSMKAVVLVILGLCVAVSVPYQAAQEPAGTPVAAPAAVRVIDEDLLCQKIEKAYADVKGAENLRGEDLLPLKDKVYGIYVKRRYYSGADIWWNPFGQGTYGIHDLTGLLDGCRDD